MTEFAEPFTQKLIRIQLQAQAPCSTASILHWCEEQDPEFSEERTHRFLADLLRRGLVRIWDNTPDAYEWKF
jgi:hypothetical protein